MLGIIFFVLVAVSIYRGRADIGRWFAETYAESGLIGIVVISAFIGAWMLFA